MDKKNDRPWAETMTGEERILIMMCGSLIVMIMMFIIVVALGDLSTAWLRFKAIGSILAMPCIWYIFYKLVTRREPKIISEAELLKMKDAKITAWILIIGSTLIALAFFWVVYSIFFIPSKDIEPVKEALPFIFGWWSCNIILPLLLLRKMKREEK